MNYSALAIGQFLTISVYLFFVFLSFLTLYLKLLDYPFCYLTTKSEYKSLYKVFLALLQLLISLMYITYNRAKSHIVSLLLLTESK
jgi:hypothetical protein